MKRVLAILSIVLSAAAAATAAPGALTNGPYAALLSDRGAPAAILRGNVTAAVADGLPARPNGPTPVSVATAAPANHPRRTHSRRLAASYAGLPSVELHAACNFNGAYDSAFGNSNQVVVWIPNLDPIPGFGSSQRAYWRTSVYQYVVDAYGRGAWRRDFSRWAYTDFGWLQAWYDYPTGLFLGQGGHVPVLFPMDVNQNIWVQDDYLFVNRTTGEPIQLSTDPTRIC